MEPINGCYTKKKRTRRTAPPKPTSSQIKAAIRRLEQDVEILSRLQSTRNLAQWPAEDLKTVADWLEFEAKKAAREEYQKRKEESGEMQVL